MKTQHGNAPLQVFLRYFNRIQLFSVDMVCAVAVAVIDLLFPVVSRGVSRSICPRRALPYVFLSWIWALLLWPALRAENRTVLCHHGGGSQMGVLTEADMRRDIFTHMQSLTFSFFDGTAPASC